MIRTFTVLSCVSLLAAIVGCGGGGDFPVAQVSGRVVCEGRPVPHVTVFFEPLAQDRSALAGKQGIGRANEDGSFVISTYGQDDGAVVGKHRVRVAAPNRELHPQFTCDCVLNPEIDIMHVEVRDDVENEFQVVLRKKTGRERPSLDELDN